MEEEHHLNIKTVYFGWKPFLPTTKLLSFILKKRNYQIADKMNNKDNPKNKSKEHKFSLFQEIMLTYYYIEYLSRYFFQLKLPSLFKNQKIILADRYFYDMYTHYRYAEESFIFPTLLKIMPRPDVTFLLEVDIQTAKQRKPEMDLDLLLEHYQRYQQLSKIIGARIVKTDQRLELSVNEILGIMKEKGMARP